MSRRYVSPRTNPCKVRRRGVARPQCTGCGRTLTEDEQRHESRVCRSCSQGWVPEGVYWSQHETNPPRRANACPDRFETTCDWCGVLINYTDGQPCGTCGNAYCHACFGAGEFCARCERTQWRGDGDDDERHLERRSNPDDELLEAFRRYKQSMQLGDLERVKALRERQGLAPLPSSVAPWAAIQDARGGTPFKKLTMGAKANMIGAWLKAQGWHPDMLSRTARGGPQAGVGADGFVVWISPDLQRRVTFGKKSLKFEVGGRGQWQRDRDFERSLGKPQDGELYISVAAENLSRMSYETGWKGWTDARQNPPCPKCGAADAYKGLRGQWECRACDAANAGSVCPGCGQAITWGMLGAPASGNQFTECGGEGNGICLRAGYAFGQGTVSGRRMPWRDYLIDIGAYAYTREPAPSEPELHAIVKAHEEAAKRLAPRTNPPLAVLGMGPLPAGLLNPGGPGEEGAGPKGFKPNFSEGEVDLEEARRLLPDEVAKAEERLKMFHQKKPDGKLLAISYDDGKAEHTYKVVVGLGRVPETHYVTPWPSNKKGYHWVHQHPEGREPIEVLDPETGHTSKIGGTARVTDWWRK